MQNVKKPLIYNAVLIFFAYCVKITYVKKCAAFGTSQEYFMSKIYRSVSELVGRTPLLRLTNIEKEYGCVAAVLAKIESFNPAGSVKDRVAKAIIEDAEKSGILKKDTVIIEPTSGNTGIGLASICASRGYKLIIVMPDSMSVERQKLMLAYGAELVLTDGKLGMKGAIAKAEELKESIEGSIIAGQFTNPSNTAVHVRSTGPEIYEDTDGNIDFFVAGIGTGGTVSGVGEYLKSKCDNVKIIGVEPTDSPFITEGRAGAHKLQGIGAGFIPAVLNTEVIDKVITRTTEEAYEAARKMGTKEGVLVGISSGAALSAAIEIAKKEENRGKTVVVLLPDTGDRYLSTELFSGD
jgi:cysteine synthase A